MSQRERTFATEERMSEHEALMWNIEKDPWLNASGASLTILDRPANFEHLTRLLQAGVARMPRLAERVVPGLGRLSTPAWAPDAEFDFSYHLREMELTGNGDERELFDLAASLYAEPLDRTRPLWRFVSISGLEGGRGAIWALIHHVISDGIGQLRIAEMYQQLNRDDAPPAAVDLDAIVAEAAANADSKEAGADVGASLGDAARHSLSHLARRQVGIARRVAGEVMLWPADPQRAAEKISKVSETVESTMRQLAPSDDEDYGSPLWTERSRHRHLEHVAVPVESLKAAGATVDGSVNDAFLAGLAEGAHRYHAARGIPVQNFSSSFVLSTRTDAHAGGNSFTPVPVRLPGGPMSVQERLRHTNAAITAARDTAERTGGMGGLSGVVNLMPTSVVTRLARAQGAKIDFATSNLRGAPFELYCAGGKVLRTVVMGPVAGTGANITALSNNGTFDIGLFIDPAAITEPAAFRADVEAAFADLFAATGVTSTAPKAATKPAPAKKTTARKKAPTKMKASANKTVAKKTTAKKSAAKKATPKKTAAKKAPAKKTTVKKAAAKKTTAKKAPAKKTAAKKAPAKKTAAKKTPAKKTATKKAPAKKATPRRRSS